MMFATGGTSTQLQYGSSVMIVGRNSFMHNEAAHDDGLGPQGAMSISSQ